MRRGERGCLECEVGVKVLACWEIEDAVLAGHFVSGVMRVGVVQLL